MRVDLEEIRRLQARRREINSVPLAEIEWYENDVRIEIEPDAILDWTFTGLLNTDFALMELCDGDE